MRVLHLGKYFPPYAGGMETFLRDLVFALARGGVDVAALVHRGEPGIGTVTDRYPAGRREVAVTRAGVWGRLLFTPISPAYPLLLARLLRRWRPQLIHVHLPSPSAFWLLLSPRARRLPWVLHWHADAIDSRAGRLYQWIYRCLYRPLQSALLRGCRAIVVTSPPYLDSSEPLQPHRDKCVVIPLGIDPDELLALAPPGDDAERPGGDFRLLAVGRLTYYKGFDVLLRVLARLPGARLAIVGQGEEEGRLRQLARDGGVADRVEFTGALTPRELALRFRGCNCLCLASTERSEAFGIVLLEAMCFGKPVVASAIPGSGVAWVVEQGQCGVTVPPGDVDAWAAALEELGADAARCRQLGQRGRERFAQRFHIDACAAAVRQLYAECCGAAPV